MRNVVVAAKEHVSRTVCARVRIYGHATRAIYTCNDLHIARLNDYNINKRLEQALLRGRAYLHRRTRMVSTALAITGAPRSRQTRTNTTDLRIMYIRELVSDNNVEFSAAVLWENFSPRTR